MPIKRPSLRALLPLALLACACAPSPAVTLPDPSTAPPLTISAGPPTASTSSIDIASIHRARCGACHVRVEPGTRSRDALVAALARHRKRVHLSEPQWSALLDYLASPPASSAPAG